MATRAVTGVRSMLTWTGTGIWAVFDQGLFAIANFGLNVALARWLGAAEYGAFATIYALFLLLATAHTALVVEPMLVFASGRFRKGRDDYLARVMRLHWWIGAGCAAGLGAIGVLLSRSSGGIAGFALLAATVAAPAILYQWLTRRACYLDLKPHRAALGGVLYLVAVAGGTLLLHSLQQLSAGAAFLVLGAASLVSGFFLWWRYLKPATSATPAERAPVSVAPHLREHWRYGRWSVLASALVWFTGDVFYVVLPLLHDLEAAAQLRAAANLLMPAVQGFSALAIVAIPVLVRARTSGGFRRTLGVALGVFVLLGFIYGALLLIWARPLVMLFYGPGFANVVAPLVVFSFVPGAYAAALLLASALRALERPKDVVKANLVPALFVVTCGMLFAYLYGPLGAAIGMAASAWLTALATGWLVLRKLHEAPAGVLPLPPARDERHTSSMG